MQHIKTIAHWLDNARDAVAFTGAGISTESGIPDFRSPGGIWSRTQPVYFDDYLRSAEARLEYWRQKVEAHTDFSQAMPNAAHKLLANWEQGGRLRGVVTQNIDGLHQLAGSRRVLELHGTAREVACLNCDWRCGADGISGQFRESGIVPDCPACGGVLKHATVSFGQSLPGDVFDEAMLWAREADLFLAIGSSLVVEPAASLPVIAKENGSRLAIINRDSTPLDSIADWVVNANIGEAMKRIEIALREPK